MARTKRELYRLWPHSETGIYQVCWSTPHGTERRSTGTKVLSEAESFRSCFVADLDKPKAPQQPTLEYILKRYEKEHADMRSIETVGYHLKSLLPFFGDLESKHLSNATLKRYAADRHKEGRTNGTILRQLGTLKASVNHALAEGWITVAPVMDMPVTQPAPKEHWLTKGQVSELIANCKSIHQEVFIRLALATAARTSAVLELKWQEVNFETGIINFGRGWGNKRRAKVPMNDELKDCLKIAQEMAITDYVVEYHGAPIKRARRAFARLSEELGFKCSPHILRHSAATWMIMEGRSFEEVAKFLGDSVKTVERVYGHHAPDYLKEAANALSLGAVQSKAMKKRLAA